MNGAGIEPLSPAIAIVGPGSSKSPAYFIRLDWSEDRVTQVHDFRYVAYIASGKGSPALSDIKLDSWE
ncbi:MAG: hypothetical protein ABI969_06130 [bacterium]